VQLCLWECPGRTGSGDDQEWGVSWQPPSVSRPSGRWPAQRPFGRTSSSGRAMRLRGRLRRHGCRATHMRPAYASSYGALELHPVRCDVRLRGADLESLVIIACENGALAHGITPAWYDSRRLPSMAEIVTQRCGLNES